MVVIRSGLAVSSAGRAGFILEGHFFGFIAAIFDGLLSARSMMYRAGFPDLAIQPFFCTGNSSSNVLNFFGIY